MSSSLSEEKQAEENKVQLPDAWPVILHTFPEYLYC